MYSHVAIFLYQEFDTARDARVKREQTLSALTRHMQVVEETGDGSASLEFSQQVPSNPANEIEA